jgi:uncharacterized protein (TIGR02231 family)
VKDAGWYPAYDVRVKKVSDPLYVLMNANVFQRSGETWKNVSLVLSTGNPNDNATPSLLQPWRLGFYDPSVSIRDQNNQEPSSTSLNEVVVTGYANQLRGAVTGVSLEKNKMLDKETIQTVFVTTQFQPTTTIYKIDDKYNLETDGKTTTIGIKEFNIPAIYDYYTSPKIDPSAFLTAKIINWQDYNLQSGEASLYFEGAYLGKTYIDLGTTTDTLSLSLGKDNGVKITRKLVKEFSSKKFIGNNRTDTKGYEISIRNTKSVPVSIRVLDQFPVSTNRDITVDDVKAPDSQIDKENGMVTWTITLQGGQEKKLRIGYSVKYPKDRMVALE